MLLCWILMRFSAFGIYNLWLLFFEEFSCNERKLGSYCNGCSLLLQRCTWWRDTGLTWINPRDVSAARARSRAAPGSRFAPKLPSPFTMGPQPASTHLRTQALHSDSNTTASASLPQTVSTVTLPSQPTAALSLTQFFHLSLPNVSYIGSESGVLLLVSLRTGSGVWLRGSATGAASTAATHDIWGGRRGARSFYSGDHSPAVAGGLRGRETSRVSGDDSVIARSVTQAFIDNRRLISNHLICLFSFHI